MSIRRKLLVVLIVCISMGLVLALCVAGINAYVIHSVRARVYTPETLVCENADCILVLGAGLRPDGSPSDMLRDRLAYALLLWDKGVSDTILVSGDRASATYDEVRAMKDYLVSHGVPEEHILEDPAGFCTYDSVYRAKTVYGMHAPVVVTQRYHLYRALYIAKALDLEVCGVNSDPFTYRGQALRDIREMVARVKDFLVCATHTGTP